MDKVVTFGFEEDFIAQLTGLILSDYGPSLPDLGRVACVFGGKRPALFVRRSLARSIKKSFVPPQFFSMDEFVDRLFARHSDASPAGELDAAFLLYRLAQQSAPGLLGTKKDFVSFLPWATEILGFIEQLDLEDIRAKVLQEVSLSATIGFDVPESINALLAHLLTVRTEYHRRLREQNLSSRGVRYLAAAEQAAQSDPEEFESILFCNVFYLHATEKRLIRALYEKGKARLIFQGSAEDYSVLRDLESEFGCTIRPDQEKRQAPDVSLYSCFDSHSQAGAVRSILQKLPDKDDTVIVLPQPENLVMLLSEIASSVDDLNVSMGYPLSRSALVSLLKAMHKAQQTKKERSFYTQDYLALLSHPLLKNLGVNKDAAVCRILAHTVEEVLIGMQKSRLGGRLFIELSDIESERSIYEKAQETLAAAGIEASFKQLQDLLVLLHATFFKPWEEVRNLNDFSGALKRCLEFLIAHGMMSLYPLNLLAADRLFSLLDECAVCSARQEPFSCGDVFKIFLERLGQQVVSLSGSPLKGLQILGLFETRSLNFSHVIIMDVNESVLPQVKIYDPLVPREVCLAMGLNRLEKEEEIQRYHFDRLVNNARTVHLVYEQGKDKEKSRFVERLIWDRQRSQAALESVAQPRARYQVEVMPNREQVEKTPEVLSYLHDFTYSATSLNTYLSCPLRFYYQYVLRLEEKPELVEDPEARTIGVFLHELLCEAYAPYVLREPKINAAFRRSVSALFEERFAQTFERTMKSDAFLLKEVLMFRLERFLDFEKQRPQSVIVGLEQQFQSTLNLDGRPCKMVLKVDRIERGKDASVLIIDYKTGSAEKMPKDIAVIDAAGYSRLALKRTMGSFQLPLYWYVLRAAYPEAPMVNAALYNLRIPEMDYFLKDIDNDDLDARARTYELALGAMIAEIRDPRSCFGADEDNPHYCSLCPFFYLCR